MGWALTSSAWCGEHPAMALLFLYWALARILQLIRFSCGKETDLELPPTLRWHTSGDRAAAAGTAPLAFEGRLTAATTDPPGFAGTDDPSAPGTEASGPPASNDPRCPGNASSATDLLHRPEGGAVFSLRHSCPRGVGPLVPSPVPFIGTKAPSPHPHYGRTVGTVGPRGSETPPGRRAKGEGSCDERYSTS